jgi:hypothetical protein
VEKLADVLMRLARGQGASGLDLLLARGRTKTAAIAVVILESCTGVMPRSMAQSESGLPLLRTTIFAGRTPRP